MSNDTGCKKVNPGDKQRLIDSKKTAEEGQSIPLNVPGRERASCVRARADGDDDGGDEHGGAELERARGSTDLYLRQLGGRGAELPRAPINSLYGNSLCGLTSRGRVSR